MNSYIYTIEDEYLGILLTIEGEVITFADENCPDVIINEISYGDKTLELWPFSDRFIEYLKDKLYQTWVQEK
jgi:hypothetical protein